MFKFFVYSIMIILFIAFMFFSLALLLRAFLFMMKSIKKMLGGEGVGKKNT